MSSEKITVRGARQHNLKNIDVELPRDKLVLGAGHRHLPDRCLSLGLRRESQTLGGKTSHRGHQAPGPAAGRDLCR